MRTLNTQQYINSGILEAYLLGLASDEEQQEVQQMAATYSEVSSALNELEGTIEDVCLQNAVPPPPGTWELLEARMHGREIKKRPKEDYRQYNRTAPEPEKPNYVEVQVDDTHIRVHKYWRPAFIAIFILSKIFLVLALYYYFKSDSLEKEIERLKTEVHQTPNRR